MNKKTIEPADESPLFLYTFSMITHDKTMFIVLIRSLIIFVFLIVGIRLMGKRTIGELQPYEFVITLAVADLACTPMQDLSIPLLYGLVPLFSIFVMHYIMTMLSAKFIRFRKVLNGKPFVVIDSDGINSECLTKLNMDVNDLIGLIRQQGYFSIEQVAYAIVETNGKLSVLEKEGAVAPVSIPETLIVEGSVMTENVRSVGFSEEKIRKILSENHLKTKDVVLLTCENNRLFLQPKRGKYIVLEEK